MQSSPGCRRSRPGDEEYFTPGPAMAHNGIHMGTMTISYRRVLWALSVMALIISTVFVSAAAVAGKAGRDVRLGLSCAINLVVEQTALIMAGTFVPVVTQPWIDQIMTNMVTPTLGSGYTGVAMNTPEQFWPASGLFSMTFNQSIKVGDQLLAAEVQQQLDSAPGTPLAVSGYSQSSIIASVEKRNLAAEYAGAQSVPTVSFVMTGNPYRPNGGFLARFPILAGLLTPWTRMNASPTDTSFASYDIARQYDIWADFPTYPLNLLADINALFGVFNHWYVSDSINPLLHGRIPTVSLDPGSPDYQPGTVVQQYGDTTYYWVPSEHLPMFYPLRWIGLGPLVDVIEPLVKVFVELGYDRSTPYGQVVRARLLPSLADLNVNQFVTDVRAALDQGGQALNRLLQRKSAAPTRRPAIRLSSRVTLDQAISTPTPRTVSDSSSPGSRRHQPSATAVRH